MLRHITDNPTKARKLKAAQALSACTSGLVATLSMWSDKNDWVESGDQCRYAAFLGQFAQLGRELTAATINLKVRPCEHAVQPIE